MRIGITGTQGFIGGFLCRFLSGEGHEAVSLDAFTRRGAAEPDRGTIPGGLAWVLHFGASTSIPRSFEDPFGVYANNTEATLRALEIARLSRASFLFMSSYVYGRPQYLPIDESHPVEALNPYMGSKIAGESICRQWGGLTGIPVVVLRGFLIYGDSRSPGRLIPDLLASARSGAAFTLRDPAPRRDYLYIRDFAELVRKILSTEPVPAGTYNVGGGEIHSNLDVAERVRRLAPRPFNLAIADTPRRNDVDDIAADIRLVKRTFDWEPRYTLDQGVKEVLRATQADMSSD
ncbi:MAG TPA: NAD(P)-dependent oxidoreductase [Syntrophales bacterium]|nr:NAD(P)-dependent oxidoreductase [Syntrophales bacterium]